MSVARLHIVPKCHAKCHGTQRGFTLLEVMLAMLLATVLLAAVWVAVRLELRFFEAGKSEIEQAQLARAILERIRADLQNAVAQPAHRDISQFAGALAPTNGQNASASQPATGSSTTDPGATDSLQPANESSFSDQSTDELASSHDGASSMEQLPGDFQEASWTWAERGRFRGSPDSMTFDVRVPPSDLDWEQPAEAADEETAAPPCTLQTVRYEWIAPSTVSRQGIVSDPADDASQLPAGLVRWQARWTDPPAIREAVTSPRGDDGSGLLSDLVDQPERPDHLDRHMTAMPEIAAVSFRYFDGTQWHAHWDSQLEQRWPAAVDVAIRFVRDDRQAEQAPTGANDADAAVDEPITMPADEFVESGPSSESFSTDSLDELPGRWDYRLLILLSGVPAGGPDGADQWARPGHIAEQPSP